MDRLSGLDASFLYLETPAQLMHVCGLFVLDPSTMPEPYSFARLQNQIKDAVRDVPTFTRKLRRVPLGLDHPVWVPDRSFDIERHVHRLALPTPGGYDELTSLTAHLAGLPSPTDPPLQLEEPGRHGREAGPVELLGRGVLTNLTKPVAVAKLVSPPTQLVSRTVGRARAGTAMAAPLTAPRTSFNGTITGHRSIGFVDIDLEDVREVKKATGTTVNDVVLAIAGGALRSYLDDRGELPEESLLATVPVSVHSSTRRTSGANKVSALFTKLATDLEDPLERLAELAERNKHAKDHHNAISADSLQDWAEFAAPRTFGLAVRAYAGLGLADRLPVAHNLVISNVPGPPVPLYLAGARIEALYPLGPVFHGAGLNLTVLSNAGTLHVGAIACRESVPDTDGLVQRFPAELAALKAAVAARDLTVPLRRRRGRKAVPEA